MTTILDYIGNTPLVEIQRIWKSDKVRIFAKYEGANPGGSIKDRVAKYMIEQAEKSGKLKKGMTILEATSGNTGIGLALVANVKGYNCNLVMPQSVSSERIKILQALGANIILTDGNTDSAIDFVHFLMKQKHQKRYYYNPNQFDNDDNWKTHLWNTAPEISHQLHFSFDKVLPPNFIISAIGTTGTIRGISTYFKIKCKDFPVETKAIAISPQRDSKIQGLKNLQFQRVLKIYKKRLIDETITVRDTDAFEMTRRLAREEGLFCGMSSGAAMCGAIEVAASLTKPANIMVILPDRGDRYLSTGVFNKCGN